MTDTVTLILAADTRNIALARTVTAAMAARADLPLDQLEDARLAVDEAVTQVIAAARQGGDITVAFDVTDSVLDIEVSVATDTLQLPSTSSFGWTVMTALVDELASAVEDGRLRITLTLRSRVQV